MRTAGSLLALALLAGCLESPYAPAPVTAGNCGADEGQPCRMTCDLTCADTTMEPCERISRCIRNGSATRRSW